MASTIDTSGIDATKPATTSATTASVRDNFSAIVTQLGNAKTDIETLQDGKQPLDADLTAIAALANTDSNFIVGNGTTWVAESGATVRTSLGLAIGTDVQAYDAGLADIAGLTPTDSNIIVGDGTNWVAESGATARTSLGLGTGNSPTFTKVTTTAASDFSAAGAYFGGTAAENLLEDWEKSGTWTVTLHDASTGGNQSPTTVTGYYRNHDGKVTIWVPALSNIDTTGMTAGNPVYISLPLSTHATRGASVGTLIANTINFNGRTQINCGTSLNTSRAFFNTVGSGLVQDIVLVSHITSGVSDIVRLSMTYEAATG